MVRMSGGFKKHKFYWITSRRVGQINKFCLKQLSPLVESFLFSVHGGSRKFTASFSISNFWDHKLLIFQGLTFACPITASMQW